MAAASERPAALPGRPHGECLLGPWNPGISSTLPRALYPLVTVFNSANSSMALAEMEELARFSGLTMQTVAELKPERLVLHEMLVRVMTELEVDDGPDQRDLGASFRRIVNLLMERHIQSAMPALVAVYDETRAALAAIIEREARALDAPSPSTRPAPAPRSFWQKLLGANSPVPPARPPDVSETAQASHALATLDRWYGLAQDATRPLDAACYAALHRAGSAVQSRQGSIAGRGRAVARLALALASNEHAGRCLGEAVMPILLAAAEREGIRRLPAQMRPVVMNTKGASAAGKSTLRPRQRALAERIGAKWQDFAIISPDIWRKQLLDYGSLGAARRWAGTLAAYEVEIVDRKLDRYVTECASAGRRTHMLIDRFRFDSFAPEGADDNATQLLTRFGSEVYLYFMITPPEATVERAWWRGERVGRYKAVDDLLAHNVEAYTGFPGLFFRWAASTDKSVHFEFLDNSVAEGETPRTVACGRNGEMVVTDLDKLLDLDRYRRINIGAESPSEVYAIASDDGSDELTFLRDCIRRLPVLICVAFGTGEIYARFEDGRLVGWNRDVFDTAVSDETARRFLQESVGRDGVARIDARIDASRYRTLGAWGAG